MGRSIFSVLLVDLINMIVDPTVDNLIYFFVDVQNLFFFPVLAGYVGASTHWSYLAD